MISLPLSPWIYTFLFSIKSPRVYRKVSSSSSLLFSSPTVVSSSSTTIIAVPHTIPLNRFPLFFFFFLLLSTIFADGPPVSYARLALNSCQLTPQPLNNRSLKRRSIGRMLVEWKKKRMKWGRMTDTWPHKEQSCIYFEICRDERRETPRAFLLQSCDVTFFLFFFVPFAQNQWTRKAWHSLLTTWIDDFFCFSPKFYTRSEMRDVATFQHLL